MRPAAEAHGLSVESVEPNEDVSLEGYIDCNVRVVFPRESDNAHSNHRLSPTAQPRSTTPLISWRCRMRLNLSSPSSGLMLAEDRCLWRMLCVCDSSFYRASVPDYFYPQWNVRIQSEECPADIDR